MPIMSGSTVPASVTEESTSSTSDDSAQATDGAREAAADAAAPTSTCSPPRSAGKCWCWCCGATKEAAGQATQWAATQRTAATAANGANELLDRICWAEAAMALLSLAPCGVNVTA
eukprot:CAMPEP_0115489790 /NCGR_PEP_ID=MMETSP0271-20121206/62209_1 /TAXON_ID=71861 /ORGANISM="Scrippsiella trochoidea, Strain CCMP3099" /LENGTH=115 /DNA_ID=CAMNT_0002917995 /DNA_START=17 /DNA_END=364 /DNA_ORIENTATION=+